MKTRSTSINSARNWHLFDASTMTLGRLATQISKLLIGKHKVDYTPNLDTGDYVVVINSDLVKVTGAKLTDKFYYRHSGYPGGFREVSFQEQLTRDSRKIIEHAVSGMVPHNKLHANRLRRLKVYPSNTHPHTTQFNKEQT